jgi:hypothetical protein
MQLMSSRGLEKTTSEGFDWIAGDVVEITPSNPALKIPQIGWNTLDLKTEHPLFEGIPTGAHGCMPISFIPIIWRLRMMPMSSRPVIMAERSRRRLPMTTRRHSVSPGKEPDAGPRPDRQFPQMEALT